MTITVELSEEHYWILAQAVSAAGTASHRHGMERHAERFHEAEKDLFRAYERQDTEDDTDFIVKVMYRDSVMKEVEASSGNLEETIAQVLESKPDTYWIIVELK